MNLFNRDSLLLASILSSLCLQLTTAINAYIYYTDATCVDSKTISGTFNLGYDDSWLEGLGFSMEDTGECIYFTDGYIDITSGYYDINEDMVTGYCVECNGIAGCSSTEDSCNDVKTTLPENVPIYQMSSTSSNGVQGSNKYGSASSSKESKSPAYQNAQVVQKEAMTKFYESGGSKDSSILYTVLGGVVGLLSLFSLVAILEGYRKWSVKKDRNLAASNIAEDFAPDGVFA